MLNRSKRQLLLFQVSFFYSSKTMYNSFFLFTVFAYCLVLLKGFVKLFLFPSPLNCNVISSFMFLIPLLAALHAFILKFCGKYKQIRPLREPVKKKHFQYTPKYFQACSAHGLDHYLGHASRVDRSWISKVRDLQD